MYHNNHRTGLPLEATPYAIEIAEYWHNHYDDYAKEVCGATPLHSQYIADSPHGRVVAMVIQQMLNDGIITVIPIIEEDDAAKAA